MSFSLATLWHERNRFLPGVLAVAFSALLITVQFGILIGLLSLTSVPVDLATADLWVGDPQVLSVDVTESIPESWLTRVQAQPEINRVEKYVIWLMMADKPGSQRSICLVIGSRLDAGSLGALPQLSPDLRAKLSEPGAVVVDESDREKLGFTAIGDYAEVMHHRIRLVGTVSGVHSLAAPYLFCSVETAQRLVGFAATQPIYLLASCKNPADAPAVADRLRRAYPDMATFTRDELSSRTRWHWLTATKSGVAVGGSALLGLIVGAVVTSQTLYAATAASLKEYATLRALGIPRWRIAGAVLAQSAWIGGLGVGIALPGAFAVARLVDAVGAKAILPWPLVVGSAVVTVVMALLSGLAALRSLRLIEPAQLLR
ncbi:MAG TPA: ABC transporter permease [Gemmataceae bacterium]